MGENQGCETTKVCFLDYWMHLQVLGVQYHNASFNCPAINCKMKNKKNWCLCRERGEIEDKETAFHFFGICVLNLTMQLIILLVIKWCLSSQTSNNSNNATDTARSLPSGETLSAEIGSLTTVLDPILCHVLVFQVIIFPRSSIDVKEIRIILTIRLELF